MEEEAARPDEQVADKADEENGVVAIFAAGSDAQVGEVDEEEVREGVDYLRGVGSRVVILTTELSAWGLEWSYLGGEFANFFAPVDGGGDWIPVATTWVSICD